jgi:hypothetical protein
MVLRAWLAPPQPVQVMPLACVCVCVCVCVCLCPREDGGKRAGKQAEGVGGGEDGAAALYYASAIFPSNYYVVRGRTGRQADGGFSRREFAHRLFAWLVPLGHRMESNQGAERDVEHIPPVAQCCCGRGLNLATTSDSL